MEASASKFTNNPNPQPRRGQNQIKIKAVKMIAKSLQNLPNWVAGKEKKEARNGGSGGGGGGGGLKSASERKIKQTSPKRGDVKIKIFKLIAKSVKDFAIGVAGKEKISAGNGGGYGGCVTVSSTTTVVPLEIVGELEPDSEYEIKQNPPWPIKIYIPKMSAGSIFQIPTESGGKKKVDGGVWAGIVPIGLESDNRCDYR